MIRVGTEFFPHRLGTFTVRSTTITGSTVKNAAIDARNMIEEAIANELDTNSEDILLKNGKPIHDTFKEYKVPRATNMPTMKAFLIESEDLSGPYGTKGIEEPALTPLASAIANAILDATGVRLTTVVKTLEKVRNHLGMLLI